MRYICIPFSLILGVKVVYIVFIIRLNAIMIEQKNIFLAAGINVEFVGEGQKNPTKSH